MVLGRAEKKSSTSSKMCQDNNSLTKPFVSNPRKRLRTQSEGPSENLHKDEHLASKQARYSESPTLRSTKLKTVSSSKFKRTKSMFKPQEGKSQSATYVSSSAPSTSNMDSVTQNTESNLPKEEKLMPTHSLSESGISPETRTTNYQSYVNPEATPYSPPRINWEGFLKHREQTGQELSPRSFSSLSSPVSLSPRYVLN